MNNASLNILAKALKPAFTKALKIAGKEISKKAVYITGAAVGTAAVAGTTTAVVVHHKRKNLNGETTEETTEKTPEKQEVKAEEKNPEVKEEVKNNVVDLTNLDRKLNEAPAKEEKKEDPADQAPVEEAGAEKVDHVEEVQPAPQQQPTVVQQQSTPQSAPQVIYQTPFVNPAPQGPNPAFAFMQNPQAMMGFMPGFMPADPMQMQQIQQPAPQSAPQPTEAPAAEEQKPEKVEAEVIDNKEIVLTAADIAQGKKAKSPTPKNGKGQKVVEINDGSSKKKS